MVTKGQDSYIKNNVFLFKTILLQYEGEINGYKVFTFTYYDPD